MRKLGTVEILYFSAYGAGAINIDPDKGKMIISSVLVREFREDRRDSATRSASVCVELDNRMLVRHQEGDQLASTSGVGELTQGVGDPSMKMKGEEVLLGVERVKCQSMIINVFCAMFFIFSSPTWWITYSCSYEDSKCLPYTTQDIHHGSGLITCSNDYPFVFFLQIGDADVRRSICLVGGAVKKGF